MARLYLIRRNLETFLGPMSVDEMREAYKRMGFGLQDEVCGHAGEWVTFDDLAKLKKTYPEVAKMVGEDMLGGWGVSEESAQHMVNEDTKRIPIKRDGKGLGLALTFLFIALVAFAAAVYFANGQRFSGKLKDDAMPTPAEAQTFVDQGDVAGFQDYMDQNLSWIVSESTKSKKAFVDWIPLLRLHAFRGEGMIDGISPKLLKGTGANAAPIDCSAKVWRRRWKAAAKTWPQLITGRKLVRAHWARLLAWDPHWIRRRETKGWIEPKSYYVGCLKMALKALDEASQEPQTLPGSPVVEWEKLGFAAVRSRLDWLIRVSETGSGIRLSTRPSNGLEVWTCLEGARDVRELGSCIAGLQGQSAAAPDSWLAYTEERYGWSLVRLAAKSTGQADPELMNQINQLHPKLHRTDFFTRFDYRAELKFLKLFATKAPTASPEPVEKLIEKVGIDFPDVSLAH